MISYSTRSFAIASSRVVDNSLSILPHLVRYTSEETEEKARFQTRSMVGEGIMVAHNPLHGSWRAGFPHQAFDLSDHAHATQGVTTTYGRRQQLAGEQTPRTIPRDTAVLSAPIGIHCALERFGRQPAKKAFSLAEELRPSVNVFWLSSSMIAEGCRHIRIARR